MMFCCATAFAQNIVHIEIEDSINRISIPKESREIVVDTRVKGGLGGHKKAHYRIYDIDSGELTWEETSPEQLMFLRLPYGMFKTKGDCVPLEYCYSKSGYNILTLSDFESRATLIETKTYKKAYSKRILPFFIDAQKDIMIGVLKSSNNYIYGYRLSTGKSLWECEITKNANEQLNNILRMDDDHIAFTSKSLNYLDINTGKNIKLVHDLVYSEAETSGGNPSYFVAFGIGGGAIGGMIGATIMSQGYVLGDSQMEFVKNGNNIFLADQKQLFCFDKKMKNIWQNTFEEDRIGHTKLCFSGDTVIMINEAHSVQNKVKANNKREEKLKKFGVPYIAKYNRENGELISKELFPKKWNKEIFGKAIRFVTDTLYYFDETSKKFSKMTFKQNEYALRTVSGNIIVVDINLNILRQYKRNSIYTRETSEENPNRLLYKSACNGHEFYLVENNKIKRQFIGKDFLDVSLKCGKLIIVKEKSLDIEKLA